MFRKGNRQTCTPPPRQVWEKAERSSTAASAVGGTLGYLMSMTRSGSKRWSFPASNLCRKQFSCRRVCSVHEHVLKRCYIYVWYSTWLSVKYFYPALTWSLFGASTRVHVTWSWFNTSGRKEMHDLFILALVPWSWCSTQTCWYSTHKYAQDHSQYTCWCIWWFSKIYSSFTL